MIKDYLKSLNLFNNLSSEDLEYLSDNYKERHYKKNSVIVSEGNKTNFIYIIKTGMVKLYKSSKDDKNIILDIRDANSILGLSILFSESPSPTTITTIEDSIVYLIKTSDFEKLILANTLLASDIIRTIGARLLSSQEKTRDLALDDSYRKTIKMILLFAKDSNKVNLNLTRVELSSFVGISRETLSRTLSQLNKAGLIDIEDKKIILKDKSRLEECLK